MGRGVLGFRDVTVCGLPAQAHYGQHPDGSAQKLSLVAKKAFELRGSEFIIGFRVSGLGF